jgi:uncharacterized repeat protein (TIGR01451 family)
VSSIAGGSTGDVLQATLLPGTAGGYKVLLHLNPGLVTSTNTLVDIAQDVYISNQVAFPLVNPNNVSSLDPVLSLLVQHTGNFTPGEQAAAYIITVSNVGTGNPTSGPVTLVETIPTGLTLVNMVGDGWSCSGNTCTRSDALGAGTAWPTITVIVNVASNSPSSVVNMVRITGGDSSAATYDDTTIVTGTTPSNPPNLSVTMKPSGAFTKGQTASFTLSVNNAKGASASSGAVTVIEAFPPGLSLVSMTGENWICTGDTCTRSDSLGAGIGYPVITVTVNVAANAPSSVTNMVILIGGGSATSVTNEVIAVN